ncbi:phosphopantetheine adenylyltransferase [Arenimonas daejeonensis]|uniref:phosphopantetheine adenylyltransferase n=1 Tax=Arenimonas daejeonensis TaxID=370777 RepID=UPI0011BF855C|nr:phosphopantetheine adenylyltransferase [Arenimonas daejeonensis]
MKRNGALMAVLFLVPGVIHLMPLIGLAGAEGLTRLYGLDFSDPNLEILMRHRAVLFGMVGALLVGAAFHGALRGAALLVGGISLLSFLALAWGVGGYNEALHRVVVVDLVALACLVLAAILHRRRDA